MSLKTTSNAPESRVVPCLAFSHPMSHPHEYQPSSAGDPHTYRKDHHSRGKYNKRGRGRGRRGGRPARFEEPLLLEGERSEQVGDAEENADAEPDVPYTLGTNADRYEEPEPELGPDGMSTVEHEAVLR